MRWTSYLLLALATVLPGAASGDGKTRFQITYPASAHAGPLTGRAEGEAHPWWELWTGIE